MNKGFSLIEVLIGVFLLVLVFIGIYGAYQMGFKIISQNKARIGAIALANQKIEIIRNLPYESIGVNGSFPDGVLEAATTTVYNKINYNIQSRVDYVVDIQDGIAYPDDDCQNDYKKAEITVSWSEKFSGSASLTTDITPKDLAQECNEPGGILLVPVFDSQGIMIASPLIEIKNPLTDETVKSATPVSGQHYFSLATSTYKVVVSKSGYSSERTYGTNEIATPEKPHPIVLDKQLTQISFSIDKVSVFSVDTVSSWGLGSFSDSFNDESKISATSSVIVSAGSANLASTTESGYAGSGYIISATVSPSDLNKWQEFSWDDIKETGTTTIKYQILYFNGLSWPAVPDSALLGNEAGFETSSVDLTDLATTTYFELRLKANLATFDASSTPFVANWQISWTTNESTPIPSASFRLKGNKIIGTDINEQTVYKYFADKISGSNGHINIPNLEWDSYTFSVNPLTGLDLVSIYPFPQPVNLAPNTTISVILTLDAENSLLTTVQDLETLVPLFSAEVRLHKTGYDKTQYTDEKGQTYFIPLEAGLYNLEITGPGYASNASGVSISGDATKIIKLQRLE